MTKLQNRTKLLTTITIGLVSLGLTGYAIYNAGVNAGRTNNAVSQRQKINTLVKHADSLQMQLDDTQYINTQLANLATNLLPGDSSASVEGLDDKRTKVTAIAGRLDDTLTAIDKADNLHTNLIAGVID